MGHSVGADIVETRRSQPMDLLCGEWPVHRFSPDLGANPGAKPDDKVRSRLRIERTQQLPKLVVELLAHDDWTVATPVGRQFPAGSPTVRVTSDVNPEFKRQRRRFEKQA